MNLADLRRDYQRAALDQAHVDPDPLIQFQRWFDDASRAQVDEPNAMSLATASTDGTPSVRIVLLKGFESPASFHFFTDHRSDKSRELELNPRAALCFHWHALERQVRINGDVTRLSRARSENYWRSRPIGSRIGAWASVQSSVLDTREELEERVRRLERELGDDPPLPPHWGGFVVEAHTIEFWQGRSSRLHDRLRYRHTQSSWVIERLSP